MFFSRTLAEQEPREVALLAKKDMKWIHDARNDQGQPITFKNIAIRHTRRFDHQYAWHKVKELVLLLVHVPPLDNNDRVRDIKLPK